MIKEIQAGVTAPKGFLAAGLRAGIKAGKTNKDMAMIYSEVPAICAGTYTKNVVKAAPVLWDKRVTSQCGQARAVVVNSGIANACTGREGYENCNKEAELAAGLLGVRPEEILVCSTGVIGVQLPMDVVEKGIRELVPAMEASTKAATAAAEAIMTTDTHKKEYAVECDIDGHTVTVGGMCKGSGMIHPNMGTMLAFVTSDAAIEQSVLQEVLREEIEDSFNMVSVDGDTSTNDTCLVLCNGMAGNGPLTAGSEGLSIFRQALRQVLVYLAKQIAGDGEGCTRLFEVVCEGASSKEEAKKISKAVVCSSLTKAAVFGKDANWGRILCAMGYSGASFDPETVDIALESDKGTLHIVKDGIATDYSEEKATEILSGHPVRARLHVHAGEASATAWGCDLTYEYVKINADYRS
ncbi:MAG: bifunctional glutamate N-acetyltransferase/amino-acid acetyltransferase ArgJ [Eubacteriales bacterium]|nr:bifunctional glutamate N-acetyltransferase/amino-acid acetyltransferase ArgJ [Eubacteriales bacterium]